MRETAVSVGDSFDLEVGLVIWFGKGHCCWRRVEVEHGPGEFGQGRSGTGPSLAADMDQLRFSQQP